MNSRAIVIYIVLSLIPGIISCFMESWQIRTAMLAITIGSGFFIALSYKKKSF